MWRFYFYVMLLLTLVSCSNESFHARKGVWIAAPKHNQLLLSYSNLKSGVETFAELDINTIFLCAWADQKTAFESSVLFNNSSYPSLKATSFFENTSYESRTNDPIRDLIDLAHEKNIEVHFWFEYGFMASWGEEPTITNNPILQKNPNWIALNNKGKAASYNDTDFYYNSYLPEVQDFILELIKESVSLYPDIDGIQGDDRLPAVPVNSGYDSYTTNAYLEEYPEKVIPENFMEAHWFKWRTNLLNQFADRMYTSIKQLGDYTVSFSPNIFPWALENLSQDWPTWIEQGNIDLLNVQCYRRSFKEYKKVIDEVLSYSDGKLDRSKVSPGIILGVSSNRLIESETLDSIINYNRSLGIKSETYFYAKWLLEDDYFHSSIRSIP